MAHETTNLRMLVYIGRCVEGMEGRCGYGFEEVGFGGCSRERAEEGTEAAITGGELLRSLGPQDDLTVWVREEGLLSPWTAD